MFKTVKSITRVPFLLLFVFVTYVHIFYVKTYGEGKAEMVYKIILNNIQKSVVGNVVSDIRIGCGKNKAGDGFMDFGSIIASCKNEINDMLGDVIPSTTTIESLSRENHPKRVVEINNICDKLNSKFFKDEEGSIGASYFNSLLEGKKDHNSQHYYVAIIQENNYDFSFFTYYFTPYVLSSLLSGIGGCKNVVKVFDNIYFYTDNFYANKIFFLPSRLGIASNFGSVNIHLVGFDFLSLSYFFIFKFLKYYYDKYRHSYDKLYTIVTYGDDFFLENLTNCILLNCITFFKINIDMFTYWHLSFNFFTCLLCFIYKFSQPTLNEIRKNIAQMESPDKS